MKKIIVELGPGYIIANNPVVFMHFNQSQSLVVLKVFTLQAYILCLNNLAYTVVSGYPTLLALGTKYCGLRWFVWGTWTQCWPTLNCLLEIHRRATLFASPTDIQDLHWPTLSAGRHCLGSPFAKLCQHRPFKETLASQNLLRYLLWRTSYSVTRRSWKLDKIRTYDLRQGTTLKPWATWDPK